MLDVDIIDGIADALVAIQYVPCAPDVDADRNVQVLDLVVEQVGQGPRSRVVPSSNWHPRDLPVLSQKWGPAHRQQLRPQMSSRCISGLYHLEN